MLQKYLKKRGWSGLILVRYALLQLPAIALLVLALIFVQRWVTIPAWVFWGSITLWIAKDVILFPFVWRAYDWNLSGSENSLVGKSGIVQDRKASQFDFKEISVVLPTGTNCKSLLPLRSSLNENS